VTLATYSSSASSYRGEENTEHVLLAYLVCNWKVFIGLEILVAGGALTVSSRWAIKAKEGGATILCYLYTLILKIIFVLGSYTAL